MIFRRRKAAEHAAFGDVPVDEAAGTASAAGSDAAGEGLALGGVAAVASEGSQAQSAGDSGGVSHDDLADDDDGELLPAPKSLRPNGPWDIAENYPERSRADLGGLLLPGADGLAMQLEVDEASGNVVAVTMVVEDRMAVQVMAFAAPRSEGIWPGVAEEIAAGVVTGGGSTEFVDGPFGLELRALVPAQLPDGTPALQPVRFVGIDGPRWMLRGAFFGAAAIDLDEAEPLHLLLRDVVVVRGNEPMAPRDPIAMRLPSNEDPDAIEQDGDAVTAL